MGGWRWGWPCDWHGAVEVMAEWFCRLTGWGVSILIWPVALGGGFFVGWRVIAEMRGGRELGSGVSGVVLLYGCLGLNMDVGTLGKGATVSFCGLARSGLWL